MIFTPTLPLGKAFFQILAAPAWDVLFTLRFLTACLTPRRGRFSAAAVGLAVALQPVHRGNITRKLRRLPQADLDRWRHDLLWSLLSADHRGTYLFLIDSTYCAHQGTAENLTRTGQHGQLENHTRKDQRKKRKQLPTSGSHCFVMGLLLTPSGLRWPYFQSYLTKEYCQQYGHVPRTQAEIAAALIQRLSVPQRAQVIVVGDAAFDAAVVLAACRQRHFDWVVTMNSDRVLAGATPLQRPKALTLTQNCSAKEFVPVQLTPGKGPYEAYRRSAVCRVGRKAKSRTFWVKQVDCEIHNVGSVQLLLSTKQAVPAGPAVAVQKVLMTNLKQRSLASIVEIYDLRWQIELFFRELKSELGLADYQLEDFDAVEGWVGMCLLTFAYLEWYRQQQLQQSQGDARPQQRWRRQRSHGLRLAVWQDRANASHFNILVKWEELAVAVYQDYPYP